MFTRKILICTHIENVVEMKNNYPSNKNIIQNKMFIEISADRQWARSTKHA